MDWSDNQEQWFYAGGFDLFGLPSFNHSPRETSEVFMPAGCSYLIQRELFTRLGEFDPHLFMYGDELDLSWRVWISGHSAVVVPTARLHHRGAVEVNPAGGERVVEFRTSETKRYYANRNCLLVLLKNSENILLLLIPLQIVLLLVEATAALVLIRRWSFIRKSYFSAIADAFRARSTISASRHAIQQFRKRGDLWMLRFLRLRLNRWDELLRTRKMGLPQVAPR